MTTETLQSENEAAGGQPPRSRGRSEFDRKVGARTPLPERVRRKPISQWVLCTLPVVWT